MTALAREGYRTLIVAQYPREAIFLYKWRMDAGQANLSYFSYLSVPKLLVSFK